MSSIKILLLEDDKLFNETLVDFLDEEGYVIDAVMDPYTALDMSYSSNYDIYLFDVNLPYESGFDLLDKLRESGDTTPTIFLTSRDDKESVIEGYGVGADDYVRKPIDLDELNLRIHALLRRQLRKESILLGNYRVNTISKSITDKLDNEIHISQKVVELLLLLLGSDGEVVRTDTIKNTLWAPNQEASEGSLRVYIAQLKKYFPEAILNTRGVGYSFDRTKVAS